MDRGGSMSCRKMTLVIEIRERRVSDYRRRSQRGLEVSGFAAGEVLHVGDDPERDWAAARAAGLEVFRLEWPNNALRKLITHCLRMWVGWDSNPEPTPKAFGLLSSRARRFQKKHGHLRILFAF
jgi:hypothetical protein